MSVDQIKNLLSGPINRIQLHDYVLAESQALLNAMAQKKVLDRVVGSGDELKGHLEWYEEATTELRAIMA